MRIDVLYHRGIGLFYVVDSLIMLPRSYTSSLWFIPPPSRPSKLAPHHTTMRGHNHDSALYLLPTRDSGGSYGYASSFITSGQAEACCHLNHRQNPCLQSSSANASTNPNPLRALRRNLTVPRVNTWPTLPRHRLHGDPRRCCRPTDAHVPSIPPYIFVPMQIWVCALWSACSRSVPTQGCNVR
jgi:hypothetical protein